MKYYFTTVEIANLLNNCINKITLRDGYRGYIYLHNVCIYSLYIS